MKPKWIATIAFAGGLVVGAVGMGTASYLNTKWFLTEQYAVQLNDRAFTGSMIARGRGDFVLQNLVRAMPAFVRSMKQLSPGHEYDWALSSVRGFYAAAKVTPPPEVAAVFATVPPDPPTSCRKRAAAAWPTTAEGSR